MTIAEANARLKECKTLDDLNTLFAEINAAQGLSDAIHSTLHMKPKGKHKTGYEAYSFSTLSEDRKEWYYSGPHTRVHYLIADGASTGESNVENLWRNMEFR